MCGILFGDTARYENLGLNHSITKIFFCEANKNGPRGTPCPNFCIVTNSLVTFYNLDCEGPCDLVFLGPNVSASGF